MRLSYSLPYSPRLLLKVGAARRTYIYISQPEDVFQNRTAAIHIPNHYDNKEYNDGVRIDLSITTEDGCDFVKWIVRVGNGPDIDVITDGPRYFFFIPIDSTSNTRYIYISAVVEEFDPNRPFTATVNPDPGEVSNTVTLDGGDIEHQYIEGDTVTVNIDWKPGTRFKTAINADDPDIYKLRATYYDKDEEDYVNLPLTPSLAENDHANQYTFLMPHANVSITAFFEYCDYEITYELVYSDPAMEDTAERFLRHPYLRIDGGANTDMPTPFPIR